MSEYSDCPPDYDGEYRDGFAMGLDGLEEWPDFSYERDEKYMANFWFRTGVLDGHKEYVIKGASQ